MPIDEAQWEWLGCTTYLVRVDGLVLMFDAYLDKAPGSGPTGLSASSIPHVDFLFVSHAHFDHMVDAAEIAIRTGASVVGNYETVRILRNQGVDSSQLLPASGGETVRCSPRVAVRVLPGLHSCLFAGAQPDSATGCFGDLHLSHQQRRRRVAKAFGLIPEHIPEGAAYLARTADQWSIEDGGPLIYVMTSPAGSVLLSASSGYWSTIMAGLRPDLAILALAGRPNVDGEPFQGSSAEFVIAQVALLDPSHVMLCHHDALLPPLMPAVDTRAAVARLRSDLPGVSYVDVPALQPFTLGRGTDGTHVSVPDRSTAARAQVRGADPGVSEGSASGVSSG